MRLFHDHIFDTTQASGFLRFSRPLSITVNILTKSKGPVKDGPRAPERFFDGYPGEEASSLIRSSSDEGLKRCNWPVSGRVYNVNCRSAGATVTTDSKRHIENHYVTEVNRAAAAF